MPRIYLHFRDPSGWLYDPEGQLTDDLSKVFGIALAEAREAIAVDIRAGRPVDLGSCIAVDNSEGVEVARVFLRDAITLIGL